MVERESSVSAIRIWEIKSFDWLELSSKTPYLLIWTFGRSAIVPQLLLSSKAPLLLHFKTLSE